MTEFGSTPAESDDVGYPAPDPARPYVYPGTQVLINRFGIRSMAILDRVVAVVAGLRGEQIKAAPVAGEFDLGHLCALHRALFQDVFPWAGEIRSVDTEKHGQDFVLAADVPASFETIHHDLCADGYLRGLGIDEFSARLADYYFRIYAAHPFRDGNSRALRHYCDLLALAAGYRLDFSATPGLELTNACRRRHFANDGGPLGEALRRIVSRTDV